MEKCKRQGCFNKAEPGSAFCRECIADMKPEPGESRQQVDEIMQRKKREENYRRMERERIQRECKPFVDAGIDLGWKLLKKLLHL